MTASPYVTPYAAVVPAAAEAGGCSVSGVFRLLANAWLSATGRARRSCAACIPVLPPPLYATFAAKMSVSDALMARRRLKVSRPPMRGWGGAELRYAPFVSRDMLVVLPIARVCCASILLLGVEDEGDGVVAG